MKVFFLGLSKALAHKYNAIYSPVIAIRSYNPNCPIIKKSFKNLLLSTHIILTSKNAAHLFIKNAKSISKLSNKTLKKKFVFIVIGKETARILEKHKIDTYRMAPFATSEGILEILNDLSSNHHKIFYPHSCQSRNVILDYLVRRKFFFINCPFYSTYFKKKLFPNTKATFIFTSPSTVSAFFKHNAARLPCDHYICIGPVTERALNKTLAKPFFNLLT